MLAMKAQMTAIMLSLLSTAQSYTAQASRAQTLRVEVSLVTVGVRVMDSMGREVPNLRAQDFTLYEDGVAQEIAFFANVEQPISLGLLLDRSDSMKLADKLQRAKAAAQLVVDALHRDSEYLYMPFDYDIDTPSGFTRSREEVRRQIAATQYGGGTRLYDAVLYALQRCKRAEHGRQALVVMTDGTDEHSRHTLDEMIAALQESRVQLYMIGYFSSEEEEIFRNNGPEIILQSGKPIDNPRIVFKRLANQSGAEAFFPHNDGELQSAVDRISLDLRTQYTLAYYPSNPARDGRYRRIRVKVRPKGLRVRARHGYVLPRDARSSGQIFGSRPTQRKMPLPIRMPASGQHTFCPKGRSYLYNR